MATSRTKKADPAQTTPDKAAASTDRTLDNVLQDMEDLAIFWGGDQGVRLRNLVGEARKLK